jgi:hypothetical protein
VATGQAALLAVLGRYNHVLYSTFGAAIAISGIVQFLGLAMTKQDLNWWG